MLEKNFFIEPDVNKKNILITISQIRTREYTYGYLFPLVEILKERYNVYYLYEGGLKAAQEEGLTNVYRLNKQKYDKFKEAKLKRMVEREDSPFYNQELINEELAKFFETEPKFSDILIIDNHNLMLPLNKYTATPGLKEMYNDYFDTFSQDPAILEEAQAITEKLFTPTARVFSPLAFRYMYKNIMLSTVETVSKKHDATVHAIIMDPSAAIPFFKFNNIKHKYWYFTNDKRYLRDLSKFEFAELQHLVYEPIWKKITPNRKSLLDEFEKTEEKIPFFFSGSLLNDKGERKFIWRDFFKDFSYPNAKLFFKVSLILGMDKQTFEDLKVEVVQHPNFCGDFMPNDEYIRTLKKCKTAFIARNVSANDGLTYRHIQYLYFDVLPIFDYLYDPDCVWIPKEFQDKLTVDNPEKLKEVIDYYNTHESERLKLLKEMKDYFQINEWVKDWKTKILETELFTEYLWK